MSKVNFEKILALSWLDKKYVAAQLFPTHQHPDRAFTRVLKGDGVLDSGQLGKLAIMADTSLDNLYGDSAIEEADSENICMVFTKHHSARVHFKEDFIQVWANNSLYYEAFKDFDLPNRLDITLGSLPK